MNIRKKNIYILREKTSIRETFKSKSVLFYTLRYAANTNRISFPMQSPSFWHLSCVEDTKCLTYIQNLDDEKKPYTFGEKWWRTLKLQGANCQNMISPREIIIATAQKVYEEFKDFDNAFGQVHRACKKTFDLRYTKITDKYGEEEILEQQGKFLFS